MLDTLNMLVASKTLAACSLLADAGGTFWLPPGRSTVAGDVDRIWNIILWINIFFFALIVVLLVYFAWRYRYRPGQPETDAPKHNTALELTWTFIPTVLVAMMFYMGFKEFIRLSVLPPAANAYTVEVLASMWSYSFRYPNGTVDDNLHLPVDTPIIFELNSRDVIHGFYVPVFRIKKDIVPARTNKIWVQATETNAGEDDLFCTQYCGQGHSDMRRKVFVHTKADFVAWLENATNPPGLTPAQRGQRVWQTKGCNSCHMLDGRPDKGPSWKNVYNYEIKLANGSTVLADTDYLRQVITHPNSMPLPNFAPVMPPTEGVVTEKDLPNLFAFIKSLSDRTPPEMPTTAASSQSTTMPATLPVAGTR